MRSLKLISIFWLALFFTCKETSDNYGDSKQSKIRGDKNSLKLDLELWSEEDFKLQVFYTIDSILNFKKEQSKTISIKGSKSIQNINIKLGDSILPKKTKIAFLIEKEEMSVKVGTTRFLYGDNSFEIKPEGFWYNYNPNKNIIYNKQLNEFKIIKPNIDSKAYFISRKLLDQRVTNLKPNNIVPKELLEDNTFRIFIDGLIKKDNIVKLSYENYSGKTHILSNNLKGKNTEQRVTFEIPKNDIPRSFKLSFIGKENYNDLAFKRIVLNYNKDRIVLTDTAIAVYFNLKKSFHFDSNTNLIKSLKNYNDSLFLECKPALKKRIFNRYLSKEN